MRRLFHSFFPVAGLLAIVLIGDPAVAASTFANDDLEGEYLFTVVEVHSITLPGTTTLATEHCVIAGTANFDGVGVMTLDATQRCSITGTGPVVGSQYYSVNPDGSFLISEAPSMTDPVHGQIVEHGRSLLLDGTLRTLPEVLSWSGVAMRR